MANIEGNSQTKNCYHCGRTFKNSRALCGHMWIHSSSSKPTPPTRNKKTLKATRTVTTTTKFKKDHEKGGILIGNKNPVINIHVDCPHCDKSFPSMRSLHGHQRMHPGKVWRGIQPPGVASGSTDNDDDDVDEKPGTSTATITNEEENNVKPFPTDHQLNKRNELTEESQLANSEKKKKKDTDIGIGIGSYREIFKRGFLSGKTLGGHK